MIIRLTNKNYPIGRLVIRRWMAGPENGTQMRAVLHRIDAADEEVLVSAIDQRQAKRPIIWVEKLAGRTHELVPERLTDGFLILIAQGQKRAALRLIGLEPVI